MSLFSPHEANKDEFERSSMRCGRKLTKDGDVSVTVYVLQQPLYSLAFIYLFKKSVFPVLLEVDRL